MKHLSHFLAGAAIALAVTATTWTVLDHMYSKFQPTPPQCAVTNYFWKDDAACTALVSEFVTKHPDAGAKFIAEQQAQTQSLLNGIFGATK